MYCYNTDVALWKMTRNAGGQVKVRDGFVERNNEIVARFQNQDAAINTLTAAGYIPDKAVDDIVVLNPTKK